MKLLANENFPLPSVRLLRDAGYDVLAIAEGLSGIDDRAVLTLAVSEERVILTFDRDYGELIYRRGLPVPIGILYFRYQPATALEPGKQLLNLLSVEGLKFTGQFTIVGQKQIRQRPLKMK